MLFYQDSPSDPRNRNCDLLHHKATRLLPWRCRAGDHAAAVPLCLCQRFRSRSQPSTAPMALRSLQSTEAASLRSTPCSLAMLLHPSSEASCPAPTSHPPTQEKKKRSHLYLPLKNVSPNAPNIHIPHSDMLSFTIRIKLTQRERKEGKRQ